MRYAMSILSRFRTKWGKKHFEILLKTLEYGYATRTMGLKYCGNLAYEKRENERLGRLCRFFSVATSVSGMQIGHAKQCSNLFYL